MNIAPPPPIIAPAPAKPMLAAYVAQAQPQAQRSATPTGAETFGFGLLPGDARRSFNSAVDQVRTAISNLTRGARPADLPTAGPVDLNRYAGKWYELARLPVRFQDPRSVSTAEYALRRDGSVEVRNTAIVGDKVSAKITGSATVVPGAQNDRLKVRFGGLLRFIPVAREGNYWVIDVDKDYSMALVGTPDRKFLWLLSRDANAYDGAQAQALVRRAADLGFDTSKLLVADWQQKVIRSS